MHFPTIVREIKTGVVLYAKSLGSVAGRFCTTTKVKMLYLPHEFSGLAVSCLELHALDLHESSSYSLCCCMVVVCDSAPLHAELVINIHY